MFNGGVDGLEDNIKAPPNLPEGKASLSHKASLLKLFLVTKYMLKLKQMIC